MKPDEFRIFISSTFRDLMPEREQLVKKVFPQIRALCRERGVEFTEIDLRWGITDEEAHSGRTVRICLEEIDKCRPYFLGIIGSRYGWIPGSNVLELDEQLYKDYPWIAEYGRQNKSITEMEFSHGAILPGNKNHAFIYEQSIDRSEDNAIPIAALRSQVVAAGVPHYTFTSPQELGEQVLRDLTSVLDRDWPQKKEMTPAERERLAHEAFARNRTHSYIANPEYSERFEKFVAGDESPLILWGKSGFGKSALMAHVTSEYKHHHPEVFIIRHFVGATAGASSSDDVMRHIMLEIKEHYELTDELPQTNLQEELPLWLGKIREGEKLVLAIDAVNQLTGIGNEMHWLPEFIPANVRLIVSTTPELPLEQLRKRNWQEMEILPLSRAQRKRITEEFLARYHKKLSHEQLEMIGRENKLESPLFLRTILEELRIFGIYEAVDMHLASYLASESEEELFQTVLARMEQDHGVETVQSIMKAIWASRFGLSETELLGITGLSRLALSQFLIALEFHLMKRGGLYTFFHNYLRQAVEGRYLGKENAKYKMHRHLAAYFSNEPYDGRRRDEEPWQWQQAEDSEKFKNCITDIPMLDLLLAEERRQELIGYWVELQKNFDLAETYHTAMEQFRSASTDEAYFAELSGKLGDALVASSSYKEAEVHLRTALDLRKKLFGESDLQTAQSMNDLATLYYHTGNFSAAETLLKDTIQVREKIHDKNDPSIAKSLNDLGAIVYSQGKLNEAEDFFQKSLDRYQAFYRGDKVDIADALSNIGSVLILKKDFEKAEIACVHALEMYRRLFGERHISMIPPMTNLAIVYLNLHLYDEAEMLYQQSLILTKSVYGNNHKFVSEILLNVGSFYSKIGQHQKSIEMHTQSLEIKKRIFGENNFETINSFISIGLSLIRAGEQVRGQELVEHYLPLQKKLLGESHVYVKVQEDAWNELMSR
ncbi:MAG: tetratricopeptide repeat protein [Bacteroidota bacterium]|nr:tetratricopeptide repeat protein [Bacteroidota bacterium]